LVVAGEHDDANAMRFEIGERPPGWKALVDPRTPRLPTLLAIDGHATERLRWGVVLSAENNGFFEGLQLLP